MNRQDDHDPGLIPESEALEEALLLSALAAESDEDSGEDDVEIPEDVLGLLDGSLVGKEAADARRRLAQDPALARAAGRFVASLRETELLGREAPGRLVAEITELVPPKTDRIPRPGLLGAIERWFTPTSTPWLAAGAAAILLVTFALQDRGNSPQEETGLRATGSAPHSIALIAPPAGAQVSGDVPLSWEPIDGAVRYRVVLVDLDGGDVVEAGRSDEPRLTASADVLRAHFATEGAREVHWIVRARLLDGSEVSSEPRSFSWSPR